MKIIVTFKDPDGVMDSVQDAIKEELQSMNLSPEEYDNLLETRTNEQLHKLKKWIEYDEYITVEFDTEEKTCKIIENG
jgi:hypothetical protein